MTGVPGSQWGCLGCSGIARSPLSRTLGAAAPNGKAPDVQGPQVVHRSVKRFDLIAGNADVKSALPKPVGVLAAASAPRLGRHDARLAEPPVPAAEGPNPGTRPTPGPEHRAARRPDARAPGCRPRPRAARRPFPAGRDA